MKIFKKISMFFALSLLMTFDASAQFAGRGDGENAVRAQIKATGFLDYPPVGYTTTERHSTVYHTVFGEVMTDLAKNANLEIEYITNGTYKDLVQQVLGGEIDILLGSYHETAIYDGLEFVFPSIINNPVSIILLPQNAKKVKNLTLLKKMKGGISNKEYLSDYVKDQLKAYDIEHFDSSNAMFEKLFTGKIDYIFASHFFGIVESSKLGLRDRLSFSKQVIWNMPLFFGVSKMSRERKLLTEKLSSYSEKPENKEKIEAYLKVMINDIELSYRGVVPPAYSLDENEKPTEKSE